jgi:hypothetical protein
MATPSMVFMEVPGLDLRTAERLGALAATYAYRDAPKLSGAAAKSIASYARPGAFGVQWSDTYLWYQDQGTRPRVMRELANKVIPMWVDDPTGTEAAKNPKLKTRTTASGKTQVLIFRKAAPIGSRKMVKRKLAGGIIKEVSVPRSWPGAPGRIATREVLAPLTTAGKQAGQIAKGNVGLRWYYPGTSGRFFLEHAVVTAGAENALSGPLKAGYDQIGLADLVLG